MRALIVSLVAAVACVSALEVHAETPLTAMEAYERVQAMRHEAGDMAKDHTEEGLRKAIAHLQSALELLDRPDIRERATGNVFLYFRGHDVRMNLAEAYAELGEKDKALAMLEQMQGYGWIPGLNAFLARDEAFAKLKDEPRFRAFVARGELAGRLWKAPAIASPYRERLGVEERIAGLSLFWAEARQNFVHFDHVPDLEWDKVYLEYIPKVTAAETTRDYYRVMMQLAPLLQDGHTNIYPPKELAEAFYARPPLRTRKVEDKVLVTDVFSPSLAQRIAAGEEIVSIDGVPVLRYAQERVRPFASSSTPQDLDVRLFTYQLLGGDKDQPLRLALRGPDGKQHEEVVARSGYSDVAYPARFGFRMLDNGVAYLALDHFESDAGVKAFVQALPAIAKSKGLVLDLRHNGGGSTNFGLEILSYLTRDPVPTAISRMRADFGARRADMVQWVPFPGSGQPYRRSHEIHFEGPVAVLVGPETFSAAEDFVVSFDLMKRGILVGQRTAGSTGQPLTFMLPGGGQARICAKRDLYPDGREFVGSGIAPDIPVSQTVDDYRSGRDPALDRAAAALLARAKG